MGTVTVIGLSHYSEKEIQEIILFHVQTLEENFHFEDLDFSMQGVQFFGSRIFGTPRKKSDLDVKIEYTGTGREDDLFNTLNNKNVKLYIEGIKVDFSPERL